MNWMPIQSGIGIEIERGTLRAVHAKRQWKRVRYCDRLEIPNYQSLGPARCGELFRQFLRRNGLKSPWTAVALPRSSALLRYLQFPIAAEKEVGRAIEYQIDSLHPFEEGSVYWSHSHWISKPRSVRDSGAATAEAIAGKVEAIVAIVEKDAVDELAQWFQSAGIGVAQFTVTTGPLLALAKAAADAQSNSEGKTSAPFAMLHVAEDHVEIAGLASGVALVSKEIDAPPDSLPQSIFREIEILRSELRLDPNERVPLMVSGLESGITDLLREKDAALVAVPIRGFLSESCADSAGALAAADYAAFAAACTAADRSRPFSLNLLPENRRTYESTAAFVPAYALAALIVLLGIALAVRGTVQDWRYNQFLEGQLQSLEPKVAEVERLQDRNRITFERIAELGSVRKQTTLPLEALNELTALVPDDSWVQQLVYDGQTVSITGSAKSASQLLPALAASDHFENPQLLSAISKGADGKEIFRIGFRLKKR